MTNLGKIKLCEAGFILIKIVPPSQTTGYDFEIRKECVRDGKLESRKLEGGFELKSQAIKRINELEIEMKKAIII